MMGLLILASIGILASVGGVFYGLYLLFKSKSTDDEPTLGI